MIFLYDIFLFYLVYYFVGNIWELITGYMRLFNSNTLPESDFPCLFVCFLTDNKIEKCQSRRIILQRFSVTTLNKSISFF
jgi:hypothetical protein